MKRLIAIGLGALAFPYMLGCYDGLALSVDSSDPSYTQGISEVPTELKIYVNGLGSGEYYQSKTGAFTMVSSTCATSPSITDYSTTKSYKSVSGPTLFSVTLAPGSCANGSQFVVRVNLEMICRQPSNTFTLECGKAGVTDLTFTLGSVGTIFLTSATHSGNFGGVAGADTFCQVDVAKPSNGKTYKALLANTTDRIACVTADCTTNGVDEHVGWVLAPEKKYYRPDGTLIGETTAAGVFAFPLTAAISSTNALAWTGLNEDWTTETNHCVQWNSAVAFTDYGAQGQTNQTSTDALYLNATPVTGCTNAKQLYCVSQ
jgi:hypothetical protein